MQSGSLQETTNYAKRKPFSYVFDLNFQLWQEK